MPVKVADFVHRNTNSTSPFDAGKARQPVDLDGRRTGIEQSDSNEERRRKAENLKVSTSGNALTIQSLAAHSNEERLDNRIYNKPSGAYDASGHAISVFGTDNRHVDETSVASIDRVKDSQAPYQLDVQSTHDESDVKDESDECSGSEADAYVDDYTMATRAQNLMANLPNGVLNANVSNPLHTLEYGESYPDTTIGDLETEASSPQAPVRTRSTVNDNGPKAELPHPRSVGHPVRNPLYDQSDAYCSQAHNRTLQPQFRSALTLNGVPTQANFAVRAGSRVPAGQVQHQGTRADPPFRYQQVNNSMQPNQGGSKVVHLSQGTSQTKPPRFKTEHFDDANETSLSNSRSDTSNQPSIDYASKDLFEMSYDDLHRESQDSDPNARVIDLPQAVRGANLDGKLQHVKGLTQTQQATFFASLSLDEWEEAGEWFLGQFGETMRKYQEARRAKRRVAAEVEQKIHDRHASIEVRKRKIDEALADMRSSGAGVLNSTPRKRTNN